MQVWQENQYNRSAGRNKSWEKITTIGYRRFIKWWYPYLLAKKQSSGECRSSNVKQSSAAAAQVCSQSNQVCTRDESVGIVSLCARAAWRCTRILAGDARLDLLQPPCRRSCHVEVPGLDDDVQVHAWSVMAACDDWMASGSDYGFWHTLSDEYSKLYESSNNEDCNSKPYEEISLCFQSSLLVSDSSLSFLRLAILKLVCLSFICCCIFPVLKSFPRLITFMQCKQLTLSLLKEYWRKWSCNLLHRCPGYPSNNPKYSFSTDITAGMSS